MNLTCAILLFLAGYLTKLNDDEIDKDKKHRAELRHAVIAIVAALMILYVFLFGDVEEFLMAVVLASVFMGKIDNLAHGILAASVILGFVLIGGYIDINLLLFFFIAAAVDETNIPIIKDYRPVLKIATLYPAFLGYYSPLIAVIVFDAGYVAKSVLEKILKNTL
ncbi:MAG: hypothetical protein QXY61_02030 [Candidatus Anstonellales archaeon]